MPARSFATLLFAAVAGGDLLHYINNTPLLSDELARTLFRGLIDGLRFCHVLGIHHRDLKLENLMLTSRDEQIMQLKIADFGLSDLQSLPSSLSATFCGSPLYAAPELMTAGAAPDGYDASKSDVWCVCECAQVCMFAGMWMGMWCTHTCVRARPPQVVRRDPVRAARLRSSVRCGGHLCSRAPHPARGAQLTCARGTRPRRRQPRGHDANR